MAKSAKRWKWHWGERTRLLLTLALVVLPAAALILFSTYHLRSIQRDRAVEAAIQRDFQHILKISEKRLAVRTYELLDPIRDQFPEAGQPCATTLEQLLAQYPYAAHLFIFDKDSGVMLRSQPSRMDEDESFAAEAEKLKGMIGTWYPLEFDELVPKLRALKAKGESPYIFSWELVPHGRNQQYQSVAIFPLKGDDTEAALGGIVLDTEFLQASFLPSALSDLLKENSESGEGDKGPHPVFMIRRGRDMQTVATSPEWDGGNPEVERSLESTLPGLVLAVKYRGTTVEAIGQRFLRTSFFMLGSLSLLLAFGLVIVYRNVSREIELARLKSDFVSNVSHELRTPLALIRLYSETLELGRIPHADKQHGYHRIIREESERLTALINNILDFSRIEAGRKEYEFEETNLRSLVRDTLDSYRYQIEQQGFHFELHIADDVPNLTVDREAIARSVLNLVNNALKYSAGEKFLRVDVYCQDGAVRIAVTDHGIGIPGHAHEKIFEKFYRIEDPLVHNTKGSGLGLALVRSMAQAHGGTVTVESAPGSGSTFTLSLPVHADAQTPQSLSTASAS